MIWILIRAALSIVCWLGVFRPDLIKPLALLPVSQVLASLTAVDYVLLLSTSVVVWMLLYIVDRFTSKPEPDTVPFEPGSAPRLDR
jgi:hypothetical protein